MIQIGGFDEKTNLGESWKVIHRCEMLIIATVDYERVHPKIYGYYMLKADMLFMSYFPLKFGQCVTGPQIMSTPVLWKQIIQKGPTNRILWQILPLNLHVIIPTMIPKDPNSRPFSPWQRVVRRAPEAKRKLANKFNAAEEPWLRVVSKVFGSEHRNKNGLHQQKIDPGRCESRIRLEAQNLVKFSTGRCVFSGVEGTLIVWWLVNKLLLLSIFNRKIQKDRLTIPAWQCCTLQLKVVCLFVCLFDCLIVLINFHQISRIIDHAHKLPLVLFWEVSLDFGIILLSAPEYDPNATRHLRLFRSRLSFQSTRQGVPLRRDLLELRGTSTNWSVRNSELGIWMSSS